MTSNGNMSFVAYLYKKLVWTTGTLNGGNQSGLGGKPAKVGHEPFHNVVVHIPGKW